MLVGVAVVSFWELLFSIIWSLGRDGERRFPIDRALGCYFYEIIVSWDDREALFSRLQHPRVKEEVERALLLIVLLHK
jgi:hypothetical protein